ncbi:MAG: LEA type 2 family protein [Candidatus Sumerlaeia bacterium]|nr:LEA type 2 family protein [Candidatus Sumerlaeia bacterium]
MRLLHAAAATLLLATATGCQYAEALLKAVDKPTASIRNVSLDKLDFNGMSLLFDVDVKNPYAVALPISNLDYKLSSAGQQFLAGTFEGATTIPAGGTETLKVPATVTFQSLLATVTSIRPGQVFPYEADLNLSADAPGVGPIALPLKHSGQLPVPTVPKVDVGKFEMKSMTLENMSGALKLTVENQNDFPLTLSNLAYGLKLGGVSVADSALTSKTALRKGEPATFEIPIQFSPSKLGMAGIQMITGGDTKFDLSGQMLTETPFGPLNYNFNKSGKQALK